MIPAEDQGLKVRSNQGILSIAVLLFLTLITMVTTLGIYHLVQYSSVQLVYT